MAQFDRLDPDERDYWVELDRRDRATCRNCGQPLAECSDPRRSFYPYRLVDYAVMEKEAASAMYADLHRDAPFHDGTFQSWAKDRSVSHPYRYDDGVSFGVSERDIWPGDKFTTDLQAAPGPGPG